MKISCKSLEELETVNKALTEKFNVDTSCFVYGKRSDVQRQQEVLNGRRTAEESRTRTRLEVISR